MSEACASGVGVARVRSSEGDAPRDGHGFPATRTLLTGLVDAAAPDALDRGEGIVPPDVGVLFPRAAAELRPRTVARATKGVRIRRTGLAAPESWEAGRRRPRGSSTPFLRTGPALVLELDASWRRWLPPSSSCSSWSPQSRSASAPALAARRRAAMAPTPRDEQIAAIRVPLERTSASSPPFGGVTRGPMSRIAGGCGAATRSSVGCGAAVRSSMGCRAAARSSVSCGAAARGSVGCKDTCALTQLPNAPRPSRHSMDEAPPKAGVDSPDNADAR
mmetsp:Transcript_18811/g.51733  ORF Transcript_18811/g.51733 Transcript_18811/m.51733 type:complete len:276 (-) Transcript_18811:636-1463(-)